MQKSHPGVKIIELVQAEVAVEHTSPSLQTAADSFFFLWLAV